jgi:hypothetical protein
MTTHEAPQRARITQLLHRFDQLTEERNRVAAELSAAFSELSGEVPATGERLLSLVDASVDRGEGVVPFTFQALRNHRLRDPAFPEPDDRAGQKKLYRAESLQRWWTVWAREAS